jgi:polyhydroxybutyrate depolymerase
MACDRASRIAGIVSLAGAQWKDVTRCVPDARVPVLQVHGDMDLVINYGGNSFYPGAVETVTDWARLDGCDAGTLVSAAAAVDLVGTLAGAETKREGFAGCPAGVAVELWTIQGGSHIPGFTDAWAPALYDWLLAHPKP